jgi:hypothetical protein
MARFFGVIGYGTTEKKAPGSWDDVITEISYYGDVIKDTRQLKEGESVNDDITVRNSISIVADAYANEHIFAIRYVEWSGILWKVSDVEVQSPRLLLRLGGVYHGPTASAPTTP